MDKFLGKSKVSKNYQTTLKKTVRIMLDLKPGDTLQWIYVNGEVIVRKAKRFKKPIQYRDPIAFKKVET